MQFPAVIVYLCVGSHLRCVPRLLLGYSRLCVWWWGAEAGGALPAAAALLAANSALRRGPVLIQAASVRNTHDTICLPFPPQAAHTGISLHRYLLTQVSFHTGISPHR